MLTTAISALVIAGEPLHGAHELRIRTSPSPSPATMSGPGHRATRETFLRSAGRLTRGFGPHRRNDTGTARRNTTAALLIHLRFCTSAATGSCRCTSPVDARQRRTGSTGLAVQGGIHRVVGAPVEHEHRGEHHQWQRENDREERTAQQQPADEHDDEQDEQRRQEHEPADIGVQPADRGVALPDLRDPSRGLGRLVRAAPVGLLFGLLLPQRHTGQDTSRSTPATNVAAS